MTVEDRLRATTEAVTAAMRPLRPLNLPPSADRAHAPAKRRRARLPRHGSGWLIPVAAAMAVIAVAATLVEVRGLSSAGSRSRSTPAATPASAAVLSNGFPRYYVAISYTAAGPKGGLVQNAYLADTSTGRHLATFKPPSDAAFSYVAASANDKTFVLRAVAGPNYGPSGSKFSASELKAGISPHYLWYVLRLTPGAAQQARLTRVPIASSGNDPLEGVAVSPDGRTLAVTSYKNSRTSSGLQTTLQTYSLATGQVLRTWTSSLTGMVSSLTWLDEGRTLAFAYRTFNATGYVRTLKTTSPGTSLIADSRPVFSVPNGAVCNTVLMTADGKAVICGSSTLGSGGCAKGTADLAAYSVATGKLERVLYRFPDACGMSTAQVLWAKSSSLAIAEIVFTKAVAPYPQLMKTVGVVPPGKPASLPAALGETYDGYGTIAF